MNLKTILNELDLRKGHLRSMGSYSHNLYTTVIRGGFPYKPLIPNDSYLRILHFTYKIATRDTTLPNELQKLLLKTGTIVYRKAGIYVVKYHYGKSTTNNIYDTIYVLYDFNKPVYEYAFFIGYLRTNTFDPEPTYSPYRRYGFENTEKIGLSILAKKYIGQGYGKLLYDAALKTTNALYSDSILFEGSYNMWIRYIRKRSKFFGVLLDNGLILPIFDDVGIDNIKKKKSQIKGLVGITRGVSEQLVKLKKFLNGINPHEVTVLQVQFKGQLTGKEKSDRGVSSLIDAIENATSFDEMIAWSHSDESNFRITSELGPPRSKFQAGIIMYSDAVVAFKETSTGIKAVLI